MLSPGILPIAYFTQFSTHAGYKQVGKTNGFIRAATPHPYLTTERTCEGRKRKTSCFLAEG